MHSWFGTLNYIAFLGGATLFSYAAILLFLKSPIVYAFKDKPDPRKMHSQPIPRLGGVVIITTFIIGSLTALKFNSHLHLLDALPHTALSAFILSAAIVFIFGFFDDTIYVTVRVRHKLAAEFLIAFTTVFILNVNFGEISIFGKFTFPLWLSNIVSFLWIIGVANAFNIIDGLDGLAGSLSLISLMSLAVIAGLGGQFSVVVLCLILAGAVIGFLIFNLPPAATFMGDSGSLFLGTMIAILSLFIGREVVQERVIIVIPLIAGIPIIEVLTTMVRRYFKAKDRRHNQAGRFHSMIIPDNAHIHHRFTYRGYGPLQATTILSALSVTLCCGAICIFLVPKMLVGPIIGYLAVPVILTLDRLGFGGRFKKALHLSSSRYNGFKKTSLIAVVDCEEDLMYALEKKKPGEISYLKLSHNEIPTVAHYLRTVVVQNRQSDSGETTLKKAEQISSLISRPVYVISSPRHTGLFVQEVTKNGSLTIRENNRSINELMKDFQRLSVTGKIKHPEQGTTTGQSHHLHLVESYARS